MFKLGYDEKSKLTETNPPLDYPKELLSLNGKLSPKIIDFNIMKDITRQCSRNKNLKMFLQFVLYMEYLKRDKKIYWKDRVTLFL